MKTVAIIQARTGSSRLPGKVLMPLAGVPMALRVAERARRIASVDEVVVATSTLPGDDPLAAALAGAGVAVFRGPEDDVLDRYYRAALEHAAEVVVRITADCPLLMPEVSERVVRAFLDGGCDYCSNCHARTWPRGLDTEVVSFAALETVWREATEQPDREHVMPYIWMRPERFQLREVVDAEDHSALRWTVDTVEDYALAAAVYDAFAAQGRADFGYRETLALMAGRPELVELNRHVRQKHYGE